MKRVIRWFNIMLIALAGGCAYQPADPVFFDPGTSVSQPSQWSPIGWQTNLPPVQP